MSQTEFRSWMMDVRAATDAYIDAANNAIDAGHTYEQYLDSNSDEYKRVQNNEKVCKDNINLFKSQYNSNVDTYNKDWGAQHGNLQYIN